MARKACRRRTVRRSQKAKSAEAAEKLANQIEELIAQAADDKLEYSLKLVGCRNVKAAKALMDEHGNDVEVILWTVRLMQGGAGEAGSSLIMWTMSTSPSADLANSMLDAAAATLAANDHPIGHSDRGCHYRWPGWIERCKRYGITRSMSKKSCSPDNSAMEGFFGRLKVELFYGRDWSGFTTGEFMDAVDDYIHWYNEKRIKASLGGMSPLQYRQSLGLTA